MTSKSKLIRPATDKSGEDVGCEGFRRQVMAADDDDDLQWLDDAQYPISDEENAAEYEFTELEMRFDLRLSERDGVAIDGEAVPLHHPEPRVQRDITSSVTHQDTTQAALLGRPCQL